MKKIVSVLVIIMLLCTCFVLIVDNDFNVEGSFGDNGENYNGIGLDLNFILNVTNNLSEIIYRYPDNLIPKGRSYGSWGGNYAADNINTTMIELGLDDVHTEQIKHIPDEPNKNYTSIINMSDFYLKINNASDKPYPFENPVPKKEMFSIPIGFPARKPNQLTQNNSFNNTKIYLNNMTKLWPLAGTFNDYSINITDYVVLKFIAPFIVGNVTYLESDDPVPSIEEQYGRVFIMDDAPGVQTKLDNLMVSEGSIIIDTGERGINYVDASNANVSVVSIYESDGTDVKELLENYSTVLVDNVTGNLTFTYNLDEGCWPYEGHVYMDRIPNHFELWDATWINDPLLKLVEFFTFQKANINTYLICMKLKSIFWGWIGDYRSSSRECKGIILYDSYDYHYMVQIINFWNQDPPYFDFNNIKKFLNSYIMKGTSLPCFTINCSVGDWLTNNISDTTINAYSDQELLIETTEAPALDAYNVVGNITIDNNPDNAIAILSNRIDGMWGQTPGDSGVGTALVLGIAKYMKDYGIKPKYNLTFLFTTGEEYGFRGAFHYNDSHKNDNIKYWFILDQLAFNQSDTALCLYFNNDTYRNIVNETFKNQTQYYNRTGYENKTINNNGVGTEQGVASSRQNCNSFCFVKDEDFRWDKWHRTGQNYSEGDSLNNTDRKDVNITTELIWNITKYFLVDPNCWIDSYSATSFDSTSDNDTLKDSVNISFSLKTILPNDKIRVKAELKNRISNEIVDNCTIDYVINSTGINDSIILSVPENASSGFYNCSFYLYNSTGRINEILDIGSPCLRHNDSRNNLFILYHININAVPPDFSNVGCSSQSIGSGFSNTISGCVSSPVNSTITQSQLYVLYPDSTFEGYNMTNIEGDEYELLFNNTWQNGEHQYCIWAIDENGNISISDWYSFNVSIQATINIATLKDVYSDNEYINITDPPTPLSDYYLVERGLTWDKYYNANIGKNILEVSAGFINYQDENNEWNPIECNLSMLNSSHPAYQYGYRAGNEHGLYNVYFKPNAQNSWPVAFAYNKSSDPTTHILRSQLVGVGYLDPQSDWEYKILQQVQSSQGQISGNSAVYEDAFTGADVVWSYWNTQLKEEITLSNTTKTLLQNHPPSEYGLNDESSYLVFITKLDHQTLNLYDSSGMLNGNVTVSDDRIDFKDALGNFKCALPIGDAYELNNESVRQKLTYRIIQFNGGTYLLSGLKVSDLNVMAFPVVIDPTLSVESLSSDGYIYNSNSNYNTAWGASTGTVSSSDYYISIGQKKVSPGPSYYVYRDFLFFNTSTLPTNAYIDNATLSLYKKDDYSTTDFTITVQNGQPTYPYNPLQAGDYNKDCYSGNDGGLNTLYFVDGRNNITLTNLSWITKGGTTKLCLRSSRDISRTAPTGNEYVDVYSKEYPVQDHAPKLVIEYRNQSKIKNTGSTNISGYLLIQVQYYNYTSKEWVVDNDTVNETTPRTITSGQQLALDTIFNDLVQTSDLTHGNGLYRIYAPFKDPDGNVLMMDDETELEAWYEFNVNF